MQVEERPLLSLAPQVLQDILADEEIGPMLDEPIALEKRLVRVAPERLQRIIALLRERGFDVS